MPWLLLAEKQGDFAFFRVSHYFKGVKFNSWKNQYIDLVTTMPDFLLADDGSGLTEEAKNRLRARTAPFSRIYCELGSGSGNHLIEQAAKDPEGFYLGFELRFKRAFRTAEKALKRDLKNLMVARTNAVRISELFPHGALQGVFVNFPDPWDKKKWKKHRLLNQTFLLQIGDLLKTGGFLSYKTDHKDYFEETVSLLKTLPPFRVSRISRDMHNSEFNIENIRTEFEELFISKGLPVQYLQAIKVGIP